MNKLHFDLDKGHFSMEWPTVNGYDDTVDILEVLKILSRRFKRKSPYRKIKMIAGGIALCCRLPRKRGMRNV